MNEELRRELEAIRRGQEEIKESRLEDQRRIDSVEKQVQNLHTVFNDLKTVEKEHESHLLMSLDLAEYDDEESGVSSSIKHFCCFFCL